MASAWTVRGLGIALLLAAIPALLYVDEPLGGMLAFALAVTGLFTAIVVAEATVPARGAQALVEGDTAALEDLRAGLGLQGAPLYVHDQGNAGGERMFWPASDNERPVPILDARSLSYAGTGETKVGIALEPSGLRLLALHEAETRPLAPGAPLAEVEAFLEGLFTTHDLARGFSLTKAEDGLRARLRAQAVELPCQSDPLDPACQATGCALCQAAGCALARSLERPVEVAQARVEDEHVTLQLSPETRIEEHEAAQESAASAQPETRAEGSA